MKPSANIQLTLLPEASRNCANPSPPQVEGAERLMSAISGLRCYGSLSASGPLGYFARMWLVSCRTLTPWYPLSLRIRDMRRSHWGLWMVPLVSRRLANGYGLWPRPIASDGSTIKGQLNIASLSTPQMRKEGRKKTIGLTEWTVLHYGVKPSPAIAEILLGVPIGWTDLKQLATAKMFRLSGTSGPC
mgnify:CR=1 FL=1